MTTLATTPTTAKPPVAAEAMRAVRPRMRPQHPGAVAASLTFGWRAVLKIRHVPEQMADAIGIPILFTVLFTYLFGGAMAGSTGEYLQFLLPGTLVMAVLLVTVYGGLVLNTDLTRGVLDRFRSLAVWRPALIVGGMLGDAARYLIGASLVVGLGLVMGYRPDGGVAGVVAAVALIVVFALSLSWVWTTLGLALRTPTAVTMVSFLVQFPLTFASNAFVDPDTMPGWLQAFVKANPVSHLVTAERALMGGTATMGQVGWVLLASAGIVAIFAPITMRLYRIK